MSIVVGKLITLLGMNSAEYKSGLDEAARKTREYHQKQRQMSQSAAKDGPLSGVEKMKRLMVGGGIVGGVLEFAKATSVGFDRGLRPMVESVPGLSQVSGIIKDIAESWIHTAEWEKYAADHAQKYAEAVKQANDALSRRREQHISTAMETENRRGETGLIGKYGFDKEREGLAVNYDKQMRALEEEKRAEKLKQQQERTDAYKTGFDQAVNPEELRDATMKIASERALKEMQGSRALSMAGKVNFYGTMAALIAKNKEQASVDAEHMLRQKAGDSQLNQIKTVQDSKRGQQEKDWADKKLSIEENLHKQAQEAERLNGEKLANMDAQAQAKRLQIADKGLDAQLETMRAGYRMQMATADGATQNRLKIQQDLDEQLVRRNWDREKTTQLDQIKARNQSAQLTARGLGMKAQQLDVIQQYKDQINTARWAGKEEVAIALEKERNIKLAMQQRQASLQNFDEFEAGTLNTTATDQLMNQMQKQPVDISEESLNSIGAKIAAAIADYLAHPRVAA